MVVVGAVVDIVVDDDVVVVVATSDVLQLTKGGESPKQTQGNT